jgi:hypothetical protein
VTRDYSGDVNALRATLLDATGSVSLYGTTPPRADTAEERITRAAMRLVDRVRSLPLDGLVVYDVQDESGRLGLPRPFPFMPMIDSRQYAARLRDLSGRPVVVYKAVGPMSEADWQPWLTETRDVFGLFYAGWRRDRRTPLVWPEREPAAHSEGPRWLPVFCLASRL